MALLAPGGCARICVPRPAHVRQRGATFATLSPPRGHAGDWVEATSSFFEQDTRPIMLFDGVCNLCNGGVRFVRGNDRNGSIRFEALQSEAGKNLLMRSGRAPDDISSVVLVEKDRFVYDMFNMSLNLINQNQVSDHSCHNSVTNHKIFLI
ncbi:hypothetical protein FH972_001980 [Carpinus fangiana]|uniref:Thiol-disulfide oxidoreductase DCC n=1 Tax=Carpinus fangiana TaxID=176857 RepID=A0A5N6QDI7_9ROSI|nr:hypothetical protein FH972_001980 [Carpinus fangiana]